VNFAEPNSTPVPLKVNKTRELDPILA